MWGPWTPIAGSDTDDDETKLLGTAVERGNTRFEIDGFSATYFFKKRAPAPFVEAVIGTARWDDGGDNLLDGLGLAGSIGYEVRKHWMVKGTVGWGTPSAEATIDDQAIKADIVDQVRLPELLLRPSIWSVIIPRSLLLPRFSSSSFRSSSIEQGASTWRTIGKAFLRDRIFKVGMSLASKKRFTSRSSGRNSLFS